jgi:hypothetical protein
MTDADRIEMGGEHDWDGRGRLSGDLDLGGRRREDDVDILAHQLGRKLAQSVHHFCPAEVDDNVLALEIAKIAKAGPQCLHPVRGCGSSPET